MSRRWNKQGKLIIGILCCFKIIKLVSPSIYLGSPLNSKLYVHLWGNIGIFLYVIVDGGFMPCVATFWMLIIINITRYTIRSETYISFIHNKEILIWVSYRAWKIKHLILWLYHITSEKKLMIIVITYNFHFTGVH